VFDVVLLPHLIIIHLQQQVQTPSASASISSSAAAPAGDSSMFNEVSALRKKYDEVRPITITTTNNDYY
jgi:hypothetical protein